MVRLTSPLLLSSLLTSLILVAAQGTNSSCPDSDSWKNNANATGTYGFPGLSLSSNGLSLSSDPSQTWYLTETITRNTSDLRTDYSITVPSGQIPSPSNSSRNAQYVACSWTFSLPDDTIKASQADNGSCIDVFGAACVRDWKDRYLTTATAWANEEHSAHRFCGDFFRSVSSTELPASCPSTDKIYGHNSPDIISTVVDNPDDPNYTCPRGIVGGRTAPPSDASNFTDYDAAVRSIKPFIIVRIGNTTTNSKGFADVQMVCARAKDVKAGSRNPATSAGAVARVGSGLIMGLALLVGVVAVV